MYSKWLTASFLAGIILLGNLSAAQPLPRHSGLKDIGEPQEWTIAVLSPLNHVQNQDAYTKTIGCLERSLINHGLTILSTTELRPTLRRHRIRSTGQISTEDAIKIQEYANTDIILIPSIDFWVDSKENPEYGLSIRLVRPDQMRVVGAVSQAATGKDYTRLFGVGTITDIDLLMTDVVNEAVKLLLEQLRRLNTQQIAVSEADVMAILQFDNLSDMRMAGSIIVNWTISQLLDRGLVVIEPGAVTELVTLQGDLPVGGIDYQRLKMVAQTYELNYIITGQLNLFRLARGSSKSATPMIEFGARLLEGETGRIAATYHCEATGADGHIAFGIGKVKSGGALLKKQIDNMLDEFKSLKLRVTGTFETK